MTIGKRVFDSYNKPHDFIVNVRIDEDNSQVCFYMLKPVDQSQEILIDWGDSSEQTHLVGEASYLNVQHTYEAKRHYRIKIINIRIFQLTSSKSNESKYTDRVTSIRDYTGTMVSIDKEGMASQQYLTRLYLPALSSIGTYGIYTKNSKSVRTSFENIQVLYQNSLEGFYSQGDILYLPNVTDIYENVFYRCSNLSVIIGDKLKNAVNPFIGVKYIDIDEDNPYYYVNERHDMMFKKSDNGLIGVADNTQAVDELITNISSYQSIGKYVCKGMTKLKDELNLLSSRYVDSWCFFDCKNITRINAPVLSATSDHVFYDMKGLTSVCTPSLKTIGTQTFRRNNSLISAYFPELTDGSTYFLENAYKLTDVDVRSLKSINNNSFSGCQSLSVLNIPSVTSINLHNKFQNNPFKNCPNLDTIILSGDGFCKIVKNKDATYDISSIFDELNPNYNFYVKDSLYENYINDDTWSLFAEHIKKVSELE